MIPRLIRACAFFLIGALMCASSFAAQPEVFSRNGAAINGYDPVAYFLEEKPVKGLDEHSLTWKGAVWKFSNDENKALFEEDPDAYAPQYGGYCAYAVSKNYTAKTEPDAWTLYDGKLYLNYSKLVRALWAVDIPGNVEKGDENWPGVLN
ncbi:MAG: YHS domain protein [Albidovulum sp.]|nr:YHS domain protein [Albidovulum sp.]